jgi:hypothetical protein
MDALREQLQQEIQQQITALAEGLRRDLRAQPRHRQRESPERSPEPPGLDDDPLPEEHFDWFDLLADLPAVLDGPPASPLKIFKLAKELKRRAALMTAGRDLHDIHTVIYMAAHWDTLHPTARSYLTRRMRLLYIAVTKGWPAALFYDQQGTDEFLDVPADFWANFHPPPRPKTAQPRGVLARGRSSTRRGRGKQS